MFVKMHHFTALLWENALMLMILYYELKQCCPLSAAK